MCLATVAGTRKIPDPITEPTITDKASTGPSTFGSSADCWVGASAEGIASSRCVGIGDFRIILMEACGWTFGEALRRAANVPEIGFARGTRFGRPTRTRERNAKQ